MRPGEPRYFDAAGGRGPCVAVKSVAVSGNRADEPRAAGWIADCGPHFCDGIVQTRVGDEGVRPEMLEQLVLRHGFRPSFQEELEELERLGRKLDRAPVAKEQMPAGVEFAVSKEDTHGRFRRKLEFRENSARTPLLADGYILPQRLCMFRRKACVLLLYVPIALAPLQPASSPRTPNGAKTWIGHVAEVEDYLKTGECVRIEDLPGIAVMKRCVLRPGGPFARMSWKPLPPGVYRGFRESYKAEIAAYELDKLLRLDMVPPTVERELQGHKGAATLWVENVVGSAQGKTLDESRRAHWDTQIVRMAMFDNLIGNTDRNLANMLHDVERNLILIDHSRAFGSATELPHALTRLDNELWAKIERLTRPQLQTTLRPWLEDDAIDAILQRRERLKVIARSLAR